MSKALIFTACVLLVGCASRYTQDKLENLAYVHVGMEQAEVEKIMGLPAKAEENSTLTALHYCKTGYITDDFAVILLNKGRVAAVKKYRVSLRQAADSPDCINNIMPFNFSAAGWLN